jgi:U3 small nucleolar RNA-associated protein 10
MIPIFLNLLEIIPEELSPTFKVLYPYKRSLINPPRHPLVHSATTNKSFCSALNQYVLQVCRQQAGHHALLAFWAGVMTEALAGMLESSRSGRRDIERRNHEDILLRFLPVLKDGLGMKKASELVIGCYMLTVVLAKMTALEIKVLDSLMDAVVVSWNHESIASGIICLSILAQQKNDIRLPKRVTRAVLRLENVMGLLVETAGQHSISQLVLGLISGCLDDIRKQKGLGRLEFVISILDKGILDESQTRRAMSLILQAFNDVSTNDDLSSETQTHLAEFIQKLNDSDSLRPHLQVAAAESTTDIESLEYNLQTMIEKEPTTLATEDIEMESAEKESNTDQFVLADQLTGESLHTSSFLSTQRPYIFDKLAEALGAAVGSQERLERFSNLPILGKDHATSKPQFLTFFTHVFSGPYPIGTRAAAMGIMTSFLSSGFENGVDIQALIPYLIAALTDPSKRIRRDAAGLLAAAAGLYRKGGKSNIDDDAPWARDSFYPNKESKNNVQWLSGRDARKVIDRVLLPSLEEYVLDPSQVFTVMEAALRGSAGSETASDLSPAELKKSLRTRLFSFLCSHLIHIPIFAVKLRLLKLLNRVEKVGSATVTRELQPLLEKWRTMTQEEVDQICENENISALQLDKQIVATVTPKEKEAINILVSNVSPTLRPAFIAATFDHLKHIWPKLREEKQLLASEKLLEISFVRAAGGETLRSGAKDVLRNIELPGGVLLNYTDKIPELIAKLETRAPSPKRRRMNSTNTTGLRNQAELDEAMDMITFVLELVDSSVPETQPELAGGLFRILAALHSLKSQLQSGFDYLLTLTLGSLLVIVKKSKVSAFFF